MSPEEFNESIFVVIDAVGKTVTAKEAAWQIEQLNLAFRKQ